MATDDNITHLAERPRALSQRMVRVVVTGTYDRETAGYLMTGLLQPWKLGTVMDVTAEIEREDERRHPTRGIISPAQFIPIAEETRMILPLSDQRLRQACRQFVSWQQHTPDQAPRYISVNLSRIQLADPRIVTRTLDILRETGLAPRCLQPEVTESQLMQNRARR